MYLEVLAFVLLVSLNTLLALEALIISRIAQREERRCRKLWKRGYVHLWGLSNWIHKLRLRALRGYTIEEITSGYRMHVANRRYLVEENSVLQIISNNSSERNSRGTQVMSYLFNNEFYDVGLSLEIMNFTVEDEPGKDSYRLWIDISHYKELETLLKNSEAQQIQSNLVKIEEIVITQRDLIGLMKHYEDISNCIELSIARRERYLCPSLYKTKKLFALEGLDSPPPVLLGYLLIELDRRYAGEYWRFHLVKNQGNNNKTKVVITRDSCWLWQEQE